MRHGRNSLHDKKGHVVLFKGEPGGELNVWYELHCPHSSDEVAELVEETEGMPGHALRAHIAHLVETRLVDWDLTLNGEKIPLDPDTVLARVPISLMVLIAAAINEDLDPTRRPGSTTQLSETKLPTVH